jgi:transglutaminase-like putative cysteine protease
MTRRWLVAVSYGLVAAAFLPLALSGEFGWVLPLAFTAVYALSATRDPHASPPQPATAKLWTGLLLTTLVLLIGWSVRDGRWLEHAVTFALLMTASRLFQRRWAKDYLQLIGLSFIVLLISAVVSPGPLFGFCFLAYTVLTMWGLALLHVTHELEVQTHTGPPPEPPPTRRWWGLRRALPPPRAPDWPDPGTSEGVLAWRTRQLITGRWFAVSAGLAVVVLLSSSLFFFLFPRLGMGFFFAQTRPPKTVVGFGKDAELGHFGQIKVSTEVVARVTFDDPRRALLPLRLRGLSFHRFVGNAWTRPDEPAWELLQQAGQYLLPSAKDFDEARDRTWRAEVYLEPLGRDNRVLFAPPRTRAVEVLDTKFDFLRGRRKKVLLTPSGDLTYKAPADAALHYAVEVVEPREAVDELRALTAAEEPLPEAIRKAWTELPAELDPRVRGLGSQLVGGVRGRLAEVRAIEEGLRAGWTYSLAGDHDAERPLADFLFGKKHGHCEYFATAMTLMLRQRGHAARVVHGFAGGQINPMGGYRMIRQADAHAWVEVYFPGVGWRSFDPTPPAGQVAPPDEGVAAWLRQVADRASLAWYQWVVEYDLERQVELLRGIAGLLGQTGSSERGAQLDGGSASDETTQRRPTPWWLLAVVIGGGGLAGTWWWWRRRPSDGLDPRLRKAAAKLDRGLTRLGHPRTPGESWARAAERLGEIDAELGNWVRDFAQAWDRARFGPEPSAAHVALASSSSADAVAKLAERRRLAR